MDIDQVLYTGPYSCCDKDPTNANGLHNKTLVCITDLTYCCNESVRGDWYYPDGRVVPNVGGTTFRANSGLKEVISGQQFYGSVHLFRRYGSPPGRGRFRCELPSAADPNCNGNQTLYANIGEYLKLILCKS